MTFKFGCSSISGSIGNTMPQPRQLLLLLLLLLAQLNQGPVAVDAAERVINFALAWDSDGIGSIAESLFNRVFLPNLTRSCQHVPGFNETRFRFLELVQRKLYDLRLANQQIRGLINSTCLFIGGSSRPELQQLRTASIPSGVASLTQFAQVHEIAPLPVPLAAGGILSALQIAFQANAQTANTSLALAIIIGEGYELSELDVVVRLYPGNFYFYQVSNGNERSVLQQVKASGATDLLLMAPAQVAGNFLSAAFESLMLTPTYRWFFYNSRLVDKNNFQGFQVISRNITSMEFGPIATAISKNLTLAREIYLYDLFSIWDIYLRKIVCNESGVVNRTYTGMTGSFHLYPNGSVTRQDWTMYFYRGLGNLRRRIGNWSSTGTFHLEPPNIRVATDEVLKDELNKNVFRVVTILKPPYVQYKAGMETMQNVSMADRLEGLAIDVCKEVLRNLSLANVEFFLQPDNKYGSLVSTGWDGVINTLIQGQANLACLTLSPTEQRSAVVKFTDPFLSYQLSILYKKRVENPLSYMFEFLRPFHLYTWLAVVGSVLVLAIVLAVLHILSRNRVSFSLYDSIFFSFASLIQGITGTPPDRPSGQLVIAIYWLFAFVILVAYVTNYAAMRTLDRLQADVTSLDSLLSQSAYEYGTTAGSSYLALFENSTIESWQQIFRFMTEDQDRRLPNNVSTALQQVQNGSYAFIYESPMNDYYAQLFCDTVSVGRFSSDSATFATPMTAEYLPMVSAAINRIIASGLRDSLYRKYFTVTAALKPNCRSTEFPQLLRDYIPVEPGFFFTKSGALTLNNTLGIAVINVVGCALTLLLAFIEFLFAACARFCARRRAKKEKLIDSDNASGVRNESTA